MPDVNLITAVLLIVAAIPLINGIFMNFSRERVQLSLGSFFNNLIFIMGVFGSIYLTRQIFFEHEANLFAQIYNWIPLNIRTVLYGQDVFIYNVVVPLILILLWVIMGPLLSVLNRLILRPLADGMYKLLYRGGPLLRGVAGTLVQVPRAAFSVLVVCLALNFYVYYFPTPTLSQTLNDSAPYQALYNNILCPVLNSNLAKKIPVIVNDAFAQTVGKEITDSSYPGDVNSLDQSVKSLMKGRVIEYFNGVTLDTAVQSNAQIDGTAIKLVGTEEDSQKKAYLIYQWITQNISYDYDKAARLADKPSGIDSGSIVAFTNREGVCFDFSSLYVSMCRAVGLKVRLITGQGYSGTAWGDHAWNQVYLPEEDRWINVDTTFGINADYFNKADFIADHKYAEVQGEW